MTTYEKKGRYIVEFGDIPTPRQHQIEIDVDARRGSYTEVELGFDEERARKEAKRCLSCRRCLGCALCWAECKPEAINFSLEDEIFEVEADSVIVSPGVERSIDRVDNRLGFGKNLNVITDLQLERMLSEFGPSAGLVLRPSDGEMPRSVAFVQGYAAAAPQMHHNALCYGINEAILVRNKLPQAEVAVFATNLADFMKAQESTLKGLDRIGLREGEVSGLTVGGDESLTLSIGNGESKTFDLVVVMTQPQVSKDLKDLAKKLGLTLSYANFLAEGTGLISTDKEPIKLTAQA